MGCPELPVPVGIIAYGCLPADKAKKTTRAQTMMNSSLPIFEKRRPSNIFCLNWNLSGTCRDVLFSSLPALLFTGKNSVDRGPKANCSFPKIELWPTESKNNEIFYFTA